MALNRLRRFLAAITLLIVLSCVPVASAAPTVNPLCESSGTYRKAHPLICNTGGGGPGSFPGTGGGGDGGLIGLIGDIVGGLTGGLL